MKTFKNYLLNQALSESNTENITRQLYRYLSFCDSQNIESDASTYTDLLLYMQTLRKQGVKQITIQHYINSLSHYFRWLIKTGHRKDNPAHGIRVQGIQRRQLYHIIDNKELESLYKNYPVPSEDHVDKNQNWYTLSLLTAKRNRAILGLLIWQGVTVSELKQLTPKDVKLREGKIYIPGGRKSNERELKLEAHQVLDLMEYTLQVRQRILEINQKQSERLFISSTGSSSINNSIAKLMEKLRVQNATIQNAKQIRTSVITYWLRNYNLREVQYMAGHRYISSTESFKINNFEDLSDDITKFHPIG